MCQPTEKDVYIHVLQRCYFSHLGKGGKLSSGVSADLLVYYDNMTKAILGNDEKIVQVLPFGYFISHKNSIFNLSYELVMVY